MRFDREPAQSCENQAGSPLLDVNAITLIILERSRAAQLGQFRQEPPSI
jgi:hypothetical protein